MELSRRQWLVEAQALEKRKEAGPAALAYLRAGSCDDAVRLYLSIGSFIEAGQALLRSIDYDRRKRADLDANHRRIAVKAAICFSRGGDVRAAVQLFLAAGERGRAVALLQEAGDFVNAARVEADPTGRVELLGYGRQEPGAAQEAASVETARNLERAGKLDAAMDAYARLGQWSSAAGLAREGRWFLRRGRPNVRGGGVLPQDPRRQPGAGAAYQAYPC